jgi:hypothetical protein
LNTKMNGFDVHPGQGLAIQAARNVELKEEHS